ncbi:glycerol-3-phosphate 1-O-acyltransferase PlsY [Bacillus taeanensis]|uniref:Glycerol-3-phosphate acyltransferase n=1 Tax=Bacillus taeanensis TaxID=273032 RepID=A0A366Y1K3_9BACI|nr:glycerol-3-phosphate 1-O-acyltransferase PlsY [Bacillus taeanensis]RBW70293.1 acyl-phosphate glycerol 3-phosphate acyltransferase [Bacillus taeanensis]
MTILISLLAAYLLGSISFSYLIAKKIMKVDIRQHGSGNAGATNTLRVLGKGPAILVLLLDIGKGIAAIFIAKSLGGPDWLLISAGLFSIIGHNWPVFHGFRGGKGVATTIGVFATIAFIPSLIIGIITILIIVITRYVSLGSLFFIGVFPFLLLLMNAYPTSYFYIGLIIAGLSYWRHRANIQRLLNGNENKIGQKTQVEDVNKA